jgi:MOSC domain-containing protein YiiM
MTGTVTQISISKGGVPKRAIERGEITARGITGDAWRHRQIHGIPKRTILLITFEGLEEIEEMGFPVYPGALGENLTTRGLDRRALRLGQQFRCGSAVIQLTEPRAPCHTISVYGKGMDKAIFDLAAMNGDPSSKVWGLSGFYASVKEEGLLLPGDAITLVSSEQFHH